jgi:hypothetical protein
MRMEFNRKKIDGGGIKKKYNSKNYLTLKK